MTPRGTDWSLAALTAAMVVTGLLGWFDGGAWTFAVHDAGGLALAGVLVFKLRRVWRRVARGAWDRRARLGVSALALVVATLGSGIAWSTFGRLAVGGFTALAWHTVLGAGLAAIVLAHVVVRAKAPRRRDFADRRQFLTAGAVATASVGAWLIQRPATKAAGLGGWRRRRTGSYAAKSFSANDFPSTSWVADHPRLLDRDTHRVRVGGAVGRPLSLRAEQIGTRDELVALLDCTGGFHTTQRWSGVRLDRVVAAARPAARATHVRVISRTGYRWSFLLSDASDLLLATTVGGEPLSHVHGAPVRLVAPGRRGFQWIKWVVAVELHDGPDPGALASTVLSSLSARGRGAA